MKLISSADSWLRDVEDYEISDLVKTEFNIFAPTISSQKTIIGTEYINIEGLKLKKDGSNERIILNLSYCGPVRVRQDGKMIVDLDFINSNLNACKKFIHYLDDKNYGREIGGLAYKFAVKTVYDHINHRLKYYGDTEPDEME